MACPAQDVSKGSDIVPRGERTVGSRHRLSTQGQSLYKPRSKFAGCPICDGREAHQHRGGLTHLWGWAWKPMNARALGKDGVNPTTSIVGTTGSVFVSHPGCAGVTYGPEIGFCATFVGGN